MKNLKANRKKLSLPIILLIAQFASSQGKIKADLATINFIGKIPYKTEKNSRAESLLRILYFKPQPKNNSKIGFINMKGETKIKPIYDMASDFYNGYANIIKDSTYGYIDKNGTEFLFKQYQEIYFYYSNTGIAKKEGKYGLIDRKGNQLTEFKYIMIHFFGFNYFNAILPKGGNELINNKGKIVFNKNSEYKIQSYYFEKDSLLVYEKNVGNTKLQGLVTLDNEIVTEAIYESINFIEDDEFFAVKKNNKYGFINKKGLEIIPPIYDKAAFNITENLISVQQNNKWGFINRKNETVIPFSYDEAYPFFDGLAFIRDGDSYRVIDIKNKIKFKTSKSDFPFYANNLSIIKKEGKYGYINKKGTVTIPPTYDYVYPFVDEIAYIELNGKSGFINTKGKEIIPIQFKQLWLPSEGLIRFAE